MEIDPDVVFEEAAGKLKEDNFEGAKSVLEDVLIEDNEEDRELLMDKDPELLLFYCILKDREREPTDSVLKALERLSYVEKDDGGFWHAVAQLAHKWNKFGYCIDASNTALKKLTENDSLYWKCCLYKAYSHEGNEDFEEAIQFIEEEKLPEFENNHDQADFENNFEAEFKHALGHFYTGKAMIDTDSIQDIHKGRDYMRRARNENKIYASCYGVIHNETRDFTRSLEILNEAQDYWNEEGPTSDGENKHMINEIRYYKADCLMWLNEDKEAKRLLNEFKDYAKDHEGAELQAKLLETTSYLRTQTLPMEEGKLKSFNNQLELVSPSPYTPPSVKEFYERVKKEATFFLELHSLLGKNQNINSGKIKGFLNSADLGEADVSVLSDYPEHLKDRVHSYAEDHEVTKIEPSDDDTLDSSPRAKDNRVIVCTWKEEVPPRHTAFIAANPQHFYIHLDEDIQPDSPKVLEQKFTFSGQAESAIPLAILLSEYDLIRREQTEPVFWLGLTPTEEAPQFFAQSGEIEWPKLDEFMNEGDSHGE